VIGRRGPRLVLRADAGHDLGSGHVMRLSALADAALDRNGEVVLLVGGEPGATLDHLATRRIASVRVEDETGGPDDRDAVIARARALGADAVVLDGPSFTPDYAAAIAAAGLRVASLDDLALAPLPTDVVINHNLGAESLRDRYARAHLRLLGRRFHLLRREFRAAPPAGAPLRATARRVLITMGGSDPVGATARVVTAMPGTGLELVVVLGPGFRADATLTVALADAERRGHGIQLHYRPRDLPAVMASCDLAVSASGGTLAELGYLGRPTVALAIVPDQVANARHHRELGLAVCGRPIDELSDDELAAEIAALLADEPLRRRLRDHTAASVDGRGAERVVEHLAA